MLYFSYNDYLDCEQNGKLNEVQRVGEEIVKYECHSKEEIKENPIIEILKEKNELKKFLIEFLQLNHYWIRWYYVLRQNKNKGW